MKKRKLQVGDKISWKSYKSISKGVIEKINPDDPKAIKARPDPEYKGQRKTLAALYERNVTLLDR